MGIVKVCELQALLELCFLEAIHATVINVIMLFVGPRRLITKCDTFIYQERENLWKQWSSRNDVTFLPKDQNRLEIFWDEEILSIRPDWKKSEKGSGSSVILQATVIKSASEIAGDNLVMGVRFTRRSDLVIDKCVILCRGFNRLTRCVLFSLRRRRRKLLVLTKHMIFSVIGKVRVKDNCLISMLVIHPTLGKISMSIRFCSDGENQTAKVAKMLGGTCFSGFNA